MIIYPAIDLRQGRCVRLRQGDPNALTVFGEDPALMAQHWADRDAEWLHIVNLDGALGASYDDVAALHDSATVLVQYPEEETPQSQRDRLLRRLPVNLRRLHEIRQATGLPIQFGGGLRTLEDIRLALELGADRVVLGTVAVNDPALVEQALLEWGPERIVIGLDARDGKVATHGWQRTSAIDAVDLGHQMAAMGVQRVVYTDIDRDGMLSGVNVEATARLGDTTDLLVIASGGVACIGDIERLKAFEHYNIEGVVTGQAIYTGSLDLGEAISVGRRPLARRSAGLVPYRMIDGEPRFLLLYNIFFDQWQFPRGGVRCDEDDLVAAVREFGEESGLPVQRVVEAERTVLQYTTVIRNYEMRRTIVYYLAEVGAGDLRLGDEDHSEGRWVSASEAWELMTET